MKKELIQQYTKLHKENPEYGSGSTYCAKIFKLSQDTRCASALDFGCGKGKLADKLNEMGLQTRKYDPAVEEFSAIPTRKFDLVIANDVLEHLHPNSFMDDIKFMLSFAAKGVFLNISCRPAVHHLPNGENCHTLVMDHKKWLEIFKAMNNLFIVHYRYHKDNQNLELFLSVAKREFCYWCNRGMIYFPDTRSYVCSRCQKPGPI